MRENLTKFVKMVPLVLIVFFILKVALYQQSDVSKVSDCTSYKNWLWIHSSDGGISSALNEQYQQ